MIAEVVLLVVLAVGLGLSMAVSLWLARLSARSGPTAEATMPVAPAFSVVIVLFSFTVALHGNDLWSNYKTSNESVARVLVRVQALQRFAGTDLLTASPAVSAAVARYEELLRDVDWRVYARAEGTPDIDAALQDLGVATRAPGSLSDTFRIHLIRLFDEVAEAHADQKRAHERRPNIRIWLELVALSVLSSVSIAMVHQNKPAAAWRILLLFHLAVGMVFHMMLQYEFRLPLYEALRAMRGS